MKGNQLQVLLAVRDTAQSGSVAQALMQAGATVAMLRVRSPEHLLERLVEHPPSLLVLELEREVRALEQLSSLYPSLPVVLLVNSHSDELDFAISRFGPEDVWVMPMEAALLTERATSVLRRLTAAGAVSGGAAASVPAGRLSAHGPTETATSAEPAEMGEVPAAPPLMTGGNPRMAEIRNIIEKVSGTNVTVLIRGESGVGKEVVARLLFENSRRRNKPFVKVNCAAIPHDLLESELFGYEAGAFTGAMRSKPGKFELADHGTLFLDEIAEMHPTLQAKLLHVLQDGRFSRLGAKRDVSVDVRVLCATNKLLEDRVREGLFREDLLYRINVVTISLPPLRERRDEIPILTEYLLGKYAAQFGRHVDPLSPEVTRRMMEYDWPGNIRELENLCKRFVLVGSETQILRELTNRRPEPASEGSEQGAEDPVGSGGSKAFQPAAAARFREDAGLSLLEVGRRAAWEAERRAILQTLESTRWNRREASRRLHVSYKALLNKIKQIQQEGGALMEEEPQGDGKITTQ